MRNSKCMFSVAAALQKVFIAPVEHSQHQFHQHVSFTIITSRPQAPRHVLQPQRRTYQNLAKAEKSRLPRDDEIEAWSVSLVDQDGSMSEELKSVYDILRSIDRKTQSLVTVVPASDGVPPICKIMDKKFLRDQEKSQRKSKTSAPTVKTIELNWAVDKNDLAHRLKKMKEFLRKGYKVEVVLAGKKKGRKATEEEAKDLVKKIKEAVAEVEGARENKPVEGKMLVQATYYFEGPKQKKKKEEVVVEGGKSEVKDQLGRRE